MIIVDRLAMPTGYTPKVGDVLVIKSITTTSRGRWYWKMELIDTKDKRKSSPTNGEGE